MILHQYSKNFDHMMFSCRVMAQDKWIILGQFLPFYHSLWSNDQNFQKIQNTPTYFMTLHLWTKTYDLTMYGLVNMAWDRWTEGQTEGRKKWYQEVGAPPKKLNSLISMFSQLFCGKIKSKRKFCWTAAVSKMFSSFLS